MTGYQVGRPVIAGNYHNGTENTTIIQRTSVNLWKAGTLFNQVG